MKVNNSNFVSIDDLEENQDTGLTPQQEEDLEKDLKEIQRLIGDKMYANNEENKREPVYKRINF